MHGFSRNAPQSFKRQWAATLEKIGTHRDLLRGRQAHKSIARAGYEEDRFMANTLLQMYGKCGSVQDARLVFDTIAAPNAFSFTMMLVAYAENGYLALARGFFDLIQNPSVICFNAMLAAYTRFKLMTSVEILFERIDTRDVTSWNTMVAGYAQTGHLAKARHAFQSMDLDGIAPNEVSFVTVLDVCSSGRDVRWIQSRLGDWDGDGDDCNESPKIGNALIVALGRFSQIDRAESIFHAMPRKNVVSWTALMAAYARNGHPRDAVRSFRAMNLEGERPNEVTIVTLLQSISSISSDSSAGMIAAMAAEFPQSLLVNNAILSFHSKLGDLELARSVFRALPTRDAISFNAMIAGHAQNGRSRDALFLAREMRIEGIAPDSASFTAILWACGHGGLLREAWMEFVGMSVDFGIAPSVEHYACVADLLGRGGRVAEAEELVQSMPFEPDYVSWTGLLDACRSDSDRERARDAAQQMRALRPEKSSPYVLALF